MSTGQGYDNTDKTIAAVILTGAIILLPGGYFTYNLYQKLGDARAQIETTKADAEKVSGQLQGEIEDMQDQLVKSQKELEAVRKELERLAQDRETLAACLTGVVDSLALLDSGDGAAALYKLGSVESDCEKSEGIIESLSSSNSSDIPLTSS